MNAIDIAHRAIGEQIMNAIDRAQRAYDNMAPPDEFCPVCGREATCDCICTGEIIDIEEEEEDE